MADLNTPLAVGAAATGVTLLGIPTGLEPALLVAGFLGAVWAQGYQLGMPWHQRALLLAVSPLLAGYLAPLLAAYLITTYPFIQGVFTQAMLQLPAAALFGLITHELGYRIKQVVGAKLGKETPQ